MKTNYHVSGLLSCVEIYLLCDSIDYCYAEHHPYNRMISMSVRPPFGLAPTNYGRTLAGECLPSCDVACWCFEVSN